MRITQQLLFFGTLLICLTGNLFAQERAWQTTSLNNDNWSILAPGIMKPDSEAQEPSSHKGSYSYNDANGFFAIIYRDSPTRLVPWGPNHEAHFNKNRDEAVKANKGELIKDVAFSNGKIKGREIQIKWLNGSIPGRETQAKPLYRVQRARMFFVGKRYYVLLVVLPEEDINTPEIDKFMNSFVVK